MDNTQSIPRGTTSSSRMLGAMLTIGVMCALFIVLTYEGTLPFIEKNKAAALEAAIFKVLPGTVQKEPFLFQENGQFQQVDATVKEGDIVYAGYDENGTLVGLAIEASGMGFADILKILYGYDPVKEAIIGFYVLESKETPGLGDKIEKDPAFLANFEALAADLDPTSKQIANKIIPVKFGEKENPWEVDGITGATISSRAIGNILGESTVAWVPKIYEQQSIFIKESTQKAAQ